MSPRPPLGVPHPLRAGDGTRLVLREFDGPAGAPRMLLLHGFWRSGLSPRMRRLAAHFSDRYRPWVLDQRGHGGSGGVFLFGRREVDDLAVVLDYLKGRDDAPVGMIGFSMGGVFAVSALGRDPGRFAQVSSVATVSSPVNPARLSVPFWDLRICAGIRPAEVWRVPRFLPPQIIPGRPDPLVGAASLDGVPLMVVHSRDDWLIPESHARAYHEAATGPTKLVILDNRCRSHADALMVYAREQLFGALDEWFDETLPAAASATNPV